MAKDKTPKKLSDLLSAINKCAKEFGFAEGVNGLFRDCITKSDNIRKPADNDSNFWFGYIREDQNTGGAYEGLSYVIFPEYKKTRCLVSIGIGSSSIGKDGDLAANPGFRRSFMRLVKNEEESTRFFFKLSFDDMETSTPGLQEELFDDTKNYEDVLINTSTKYNADSDKEAPGLLPAALIVDYSTDNGWKLVKAWLAQYAQWRNWEKFQKGTDKSRIKATIENAIQECKCSPQCPDTADIKKILDEQKYVVLQGAPGCGKTWSANEVSKLYGDNVIFTQFHAETTYSDFVYGIRPTLNGKDLAYKGEKGVLLNAIDMALNTKEDVLLIIDEINRANLANVLGPVFYLFEPNSARDHKLYLGTVYKENKAEKSEDGSVAENVYTEERIELKELPSNLYVLATMNTADKSLAVVDFALRRRFAWVTLRPHKLESITEFDNELYDQVNGLFIKYATDEELNYQPGQSYFMDKSQRDNNIKYGLMPLMKEYFAEGFMLSAKEEFAQLFKTYADVSMYE